MESLQDKRILVIDDEPDMLSLVSMMLSHEGARVTTAIDGTTGLQQVHRTQPDLVLLDVLMPGMTGYETCDRILESAATPVIFLSALAGTSDIVKGLDRGAVDYVTKPFTPSVLIARINAALRFVDQVRAGSDIPTYDDGYLAVNLADRQVTVEGKPVKLTNTEFKLFSYLFLHADQLLPYADILEHVWGAEAVANANYVHIYTWRLRHKLERDPHCPCYLESVSSVGYCLHRQTPNAELN